MRAREALLATDHLPGDLERIFPICTPGASDTATFDEASSCCTWVATRCPTPCS
jgi:glutamate synthase domain-containing protein 1